MTVIVIGAGLAGLTAAATLHDAGVPVQVVEAGAMIGGRIQAVRDPVSGRPMADLGPTWVWPTYQPVVRRWLARLGLEVFAQFNDGDAVITGYAPAPLRQPLPGQEGQVRIVGGPTALIDALAARIGSARIRTLAPVAAIHDNGSGRIALHLASGEVMLADKVILSVPLRVAASTMDLPWATADLRHAMQGTPTWMANQAKAVAFYPRPFWRDAGLSGRIASRTGPLVEAHDHTAADGAPAAIFGFVGWPPDRRKADPEGLKAAIRDQLSACFGAIAAAPLDLVVRDWALTPRIATALDLARPAGHPDVGPDLLRRSHLGGRLRFAVSEVSDLSPGLIEGALAIGERAANRMA